MNRSTCEVERETVIHATFGDYNSQTAFRGMIDADFDAEEDIDEGCFSVQHHNEFTPVVENILLEVERQLKFFSIKNADLFAAANDRSCEFSHDQFNVFEVYCSMVESVLQHYLKVTGLSRQIFLNKVQDNMESDKYSQVCIDALFGVENFETFADFMLKSTQINKEANAMAADMGSGPAAKKKLGL